MRRAIASFMMLWFTVTTVEPEALHQCEMHGGSHAAPSAVETADATGDATGDATDEHAGHDMGSAESPAPDSGAAHTCTCVGECCSAVVTSVPEQPVASFAPEAVRRERAPIAVESSAAALHGVRLPFATAPPALPGLLAATA